MVLRDFWLSASVFSSTRMHPQLLEGMASIPRLTSLLPNRFRQVL